MSIASEHLLPRMAGFNVIDCAIKNRDILYLLAREDYTQHPGWRDGREAPGEGRLAKRLLSLNLKNPDEKKWGIGHLRGLGASVCGVAFAPEEKVVVLDSTSKAWSPTPGSDGFEGPIPSQFEGGVKRGGFSRARSFGGRLFASSTARQLFVRTAPGKWDLVGEPMPEPDEYKISFVDFDGFGPEDLYAVGDPGDIWHLSGQVWKRMKFPSNWGLSAVCCAGDGNVYVAAGDHVFRGLGDKWEKLKTKAQISLPIKDLVWYDGELWATNDYGVWVLKDEGLVDADVPSGVKVCSGNLATRDGVLLLAGYGGAAYKRDGQWTEIFHDHEVREWLETNRDKVWTPPN
ncbi:hypothetical protein PV762_27560 [Mitsuaria sp. CC2]|uniref:hypothetical protein n=1 Tax=Mitsuaria sp. CC2 TaxID=3029186 RepID=UPI003B8AF6BF